MSQIRSYIYRIGTQYEPLDWDPSTRILWTRIQINPFDSNQRSMIIPEVVHLGSDLDCTPWDQWPITNWTKGITPLNLIHTSRDQWLLPFHAPGARWWHCSVVALLRWTARRCTNTQLAIRYTLHNKRIVANTFLGALPDGAAQTALPTARCGGATIATQRQAMPTLS